MRTLNLGILAHVDAGKTSLTERLLHAAGVIDEVGSVDAGSTRTDSLALERRRGITIKSAVVSFTLGGPDGVAVNLIDTPGHPDFIAEVERVLGVLDGAVLVVSAVEGVQPQTRLLMRTLRRLGIPTLIFVNKVDRRGARSVELVPELVERLGVPVVTTGAVVGAGNRAARVVPALRRDELLEVLADGDDDLLAAYVADEASVGDDRLRRELATQSRRGLVHPVFFGSATTGAGVDLLVDALTDLLPAERGDVHAPLAATVFKVERGPAGERVALLRVYAGTLRTRDRVAFAGREPVKVTGLQVYADGASRETDCVPAGRIARVRGLGDVRIGDVLGEDPRSTRRWHFAPPSLETVVSPVRRSDKPALLAALTDLAEQDPMVDLRRDDLRDEISVSLYGEVQKEVIATTLVEDYAVEVEFRETTTICIERVSGSGSAFEVIDTDTNPFLATVGLRVDPAPVGAGVDFRLEVELGSMPPAFFTAVEETVRGTLGQGLHGWDVPDCVVTMTHSGYWPRQSAMHGTFDKSMSSTAGDFRHLTALVLMSALSRAGTVVHEPVHRFRLELPADSFGALLPVLAHLRGVPWAPRAHGSAYVVEGMVPAGHVHELEMRLPTLTRGEGVLETGLDHHEPVRGVPPERPRTDQNPLDRREFLRRVQRRTG